MKAPEYLSSFSGPVRVDEEDDLSKKQYAIAKHFFFARNDFELSIDKDDVVIVLDHPSPVCTLITPTRLQDLFPQSLTTNSSHVTLVGEKKKKKEWTKVQFRGEIGHVPSTHIQITSQIPSPSPSDQSVISEEEIYRDSVYAPRLPLPFTPPKPEEKVMNQRRTMLLDKLALAGLGIMIQISKDNEAGLSATEPGKRPRLSIVQKPQKKGKSKDDPNSSAQIAVALFDFEASSENELSFRTGEKIVIYSKEPNGWWQGGKDGHIGYFPSDYVALIDGETPVSIIASATSRQLVVPSNMPPAIPSYSSSFPKPRPLPKVPGAAPSPTPVRAAEPKPVVVKEKPAAPQAENDIFQQLQKRINEQEAEVQHLREQLEKEASGSSSHSETRQHLEEAMMLLNALKQNLPKTRDHASAITLQNANAPEEDEVVAQIKAKIATQTKNVEKLRAELKTTPPFDPLYKQRSNELEENETLLEALYANLQGLAATKIEEEVRQKKALIKEEEDAIAKQLRDKILVAERELADSTQRLRAASDPQAKNRLQMEVEERTMLLLALQGNLEATVKHSSQPNFNQQLQNIDDSMKEDQAGDAAGGEGANRGRYRTGSTIGSEIKQSIRTSFLSLGRKRSNTEKTMPTNFKLSSPQLVSSTSQRVDVSTPSAPAPTSSFSRFDNRSRPVIIPSSSSATNRALIQGSSSSSSSSLSPTSASPPGPVLKQPLPSPASQAQKMAPTKQQSAPVLPVEPKIPEATIPEGSWRLTVSKPLPQVPPASGSAPVSAAQSPFRTEISPGPQRREPGPPQSRARSPSDAAGSMSPQRSRSPTDFQGGAPQRSRSPTDFLGPSQQRSRSPSVSSSSSSPSSSAGAVNAAFGISSKAPSCGKKPKKNSQGSCPHLRLHLLHVFLCLLLFFITKKN